MRTTMSTMAEDDNMPVLTAATSKSSKTASSCEIMIAGGNSNTSVIANEMFTQMRSFEQGRAAAFAVVLFVLVLPLVVYNAVQLKKQQEVR